MSIGEVGALVVFPDQLFKGVIVFVVFLSIPDLKRIGVKQRRSIVDRFVIVKECHDVRAVADQSPIVAGSVIAVERCRGVEERGEGKRDRLVHALTVAV